MAELKPKFRDELDKFAEEKFGKKMANWPAAGFEDTELSVNMEPEVDHGTTEIYTRVQA